MNGDIDRLIRFTAKHFVFDEKAYPELKDVTDKQRFAFSIRHCLMHLTKTSGKISAVIEQADHGKEFDMAQLKTDISKDLINTLRLAELIGMSGGDLIHAIEEKYNDTI